MEQFVEGPQATLCVSVQASPARGRLPVVFLHADAGTLHQWDEVRAALAPERTTVAFDRRGHGRSEVPRNGGFGHGESAADVAAVVDALGLDRFALVGHSGGALTAWSFAAQQPERVAGLLLVDPPPDPRVLPKEMVEQTLRAIRADARSEVEQYYRSIAGTNPAVVERVVAEAKSTTPQTAVGTFEALASFDPRPLAGAYPGPLRSVIQPQFDVDGALHRIPPGFPHSAIEGTAHWIQLDAPERFVAELETFLGELSED